MDDFNGTPVPLVPKLGTFLPGTSRRRNSNPKRKRGTHRDSPPIFEGMARPQMQRNSLSVPRLRFGLLFKGRLNTYRVGAWEPGCFGGRRVLAVTLGILLAVACNVGAVVPSDSEIGLTTGAHSSGDSLGKDYSSEVELIPPTPPEKAEATFEVEPGFRIELVAAEPLVMDPVGMSVDERGRLFVAEMRGYNQGNRTPSSEARNLAMASEKLGCVKLLEDTDGDGGLSIE